MRRAHLCVLSESSFSSASPETAWAKCRTAAWLLALSDGSVPLNSEFFECLQWICDSLRPFIEHLDQRIAGLRSRDAVSAHQAVRELLAMAPRHYAGECGDLADTYPCLRPYMLDEVQKICREVMQAIEMSSEAYTSARRELERLFGLDADSIHVCEFTFILQNFSAVENYFENNLGVFKFGSRRLLGSMLGMSLVRLSSCIRQLCRFGILEGAYDHSFRLIESVQAFWSPEPPDTDMLFCRPVSGETLPLSAFRIPDADVRHVCRLLQQTGDTPVHILLYGASGTGKSTFVRSLAHACRIKAWEVISRGTDGDSDRRASLSACLHMSEGHPGSFVVVDEAERMLDTEITLGRQTKDKAWLNDFLEKPGQHIVWISNQVEHIDPAVRRRFTYSIRFPELGVRERVEVWKQVMKRQGLSRRFHEQTMTGLAMKYPVQAAVIQKAVTQSQCLYPSRSAFHASLERILEAHVVLQQGADYVPKPVCSSIPEFTQDGVCTETDISQLMQRCRRMDAAMRSGKRLSPGCGTMLFYGPPGTGKTELARHIADMLTRECLVKRASDLLSPFVGMSERHVAGAFREAEAGGAVLVIDEADTFLYSRDNAGHSWENSLVNEFLTSLETFRGFCICTTNRRGELDAAAMRRFSHKIRFRYADRAQVLALYNALLAPLCGSALPEVLQQKLTTMKCLAPGDFHAVRAQYNPLFVEPGEVSHEILIQALSRETGLKMDTKEHRIGFMSE